MPKQKPAWLFYMLWLYTLTLVVGQAAGTCVTFQVPRTEHTMGIVYPIMVFLVVAMLFGVVGLLCSTATRKRITMVAVLASISTFCTVIAVLIYIQHRPFNLADVSFGWPF